MDRILQSEYSIYDYIALVIVVSFLGFCLENIWMLFRKGQIDNRNMNFPFLIGYGIAILFIYFLLGVPKKENLAFFFVAVFFIVSLGEIALGYSVEKLCGFHYWDYTLLPLHFTRYTSLFTSLGFSAIITLFFYYCFTPLMNTVKIHDSYPSHVVLVSVLSVMVIDFLYSFGYMHANQSLYKSWILHLPVHGSKFLLEILSK